MCGEEDEQFVKYLILSTCLNALSFSHVDWLILGEPNNLSGECILNFYKGERRQETIYCVMPFNYDFVTLKTCKVKECRQCRYD